MGKLVAGFHCIGLDSSSGVDLHLWWQAKEEVPHSDRLRVFSDGQQQHIVTATISLLRGKVLCLNRHCILKIIILIQHNIITVDSSKIIQKDKTDDLR